MEEMSKSFIIEMINRTKRVRLGLGRNIVLTYRQHVG